MCDVISLLVSYTCTISVNPQVPSGSAMQLVSDLMFSVFRSTFTLHTAFIQIGNCWSSLHVNLSTVTEITQYLMSQTTQEALQEA